jgi:hypothetical protein
MRHDGHDRDPRQLARPGVHHNELRRGAANVREALPRQQDHVHRQQQRVLLGNPVPADRSAERRVLRRLERRLLIANTTLQLWTDSYTNTGVPSMTSRMPSPTRMFFAGQFVPQADNSTIIRTSTMYTDTYNSNIVSMNIVNQTVYVVVQRTSGDYGTQGYAFQTGFCARSGVMANNERQRERELGGAAGARCARVVAAGHHDVRLRIGRDPHVAVDDGIVHVGLEQLVGAVRPVRLRRLCVAAHGPGELPHPVPVSATNRPRRPFLQRQQHHPAQRGLQQRSLSYVLSNTTANASVTTAECP